MTQFENLAEETNAYLDAKGLAAHYGAESFEGTLAGAKISIKNLREAIVMLMAAIYKLGSEPLPPREELDRDVAEILEAPRLVLAAKAEAAETVAATSKQLTTRQHQSSNSTIVCQGSSAAAPSKLKVATKVFKTRGATARARAEAAWNARAEATARASAEAAARARARAAARATVPS